MVGCPKQEGLKDGVTVVSVLTLTGNAIMGQLLG